MAYTPTTWAAGDKVTAEKLNNIEQGIVNAGILIVNENQETYTLDKTWQEIADAPFAVIKSNGGYIYITGMVSASAYAVVGFSVDPTANITAVAYVAQTVDDYPVYYDPDSPAPDNGGGGDA